MGSEIDQARFLSALALAQTVADKRSNNMPILANVLLRTTKDNRLVCSATDMMISNHREHPGRGEDPGAPHPRRPLAPQRRAHPAEQADPVRSAENHWAELSVARSSFKLMGQVHTDFPELPDPKGRSSSPSRATPSRT